MDETTTTRRKRPVLATLAAAAHLAIGVCCLGLVTYLLYLTRSPEILREPDPAETVHGLKLGAVVLGLAGLPFVGGAIGLWKGRLWGWVISVVADVITATLFLWDAFGESNVSWDDAIPGVLFVLLLALVLIPGVRRWCWRRSALSPRATGAAG